ncbi:disease resistance protein RPP13 [Solanum tuberosum]|uniref:HJTR2GH1 protein n=1 Tax=Solanum tuberosum TaxID=4113 RepID=M1APS6_SOLTU|nr:PREDICTED: disease resistance protein RPP13 [Solanum tuberosum]
MVDAVVSYAVEKLGTFLIEEVSLRQSLRENVLWLRNELSFMKAFLKDAEKNQEQDNLVQQWVFEITSVANDAVYILEAYSLDAAKDGDHAAGFVDRLKAYACICQKEAKLHDIGKDIQSLKERVMDISRKRDTYGIAHNNSNAGEGPSNRPNYTSSMLTLRRAVSYADEDQLFVGFQEVFQRLLDELLKEESHRKVLSIYGMGGLGKTTLARNLYNSPSLITTFHTRAWISVSQQYSIPDLLRSIIKSIEGCSEELLKLLKEMSERDLETYLRNLLKKHKYLVVVDDVWHREAWESLQRALPDDNNGSRVILTTRKKEVAERVDDKGFPHELRFLNKKESWDLLCKKLHPENKMVGADLYSPSMERLANEMVEKCGGLPLAIVVLGGILSYRKGVDEWQKVKTHLWQHMKNDSVEITHILSLSYNDLSFELKQCFLYIGIFQEDHVIDTEKLMHLWLAEGFIPRIREEHMEDIAENFLHELISRSLIQVAETFFDKFFACKIHDLLRDLAVQKSMEVNLFDIYDPSVSSVTPFRHRHAIHGQTQKYLSLDLSKLKVRSILFFDKEFEKLDNSEKFMTFCTTFPHLYVLDLENIYFSEGKLPDAIGNLVHLKFLGLSNTNLFKLPSSIAKLENLQTLEALIDDYCSCQLPPQIAKLTNLRHLITRYEVPLQVNRLTNLRTLKYIRCDQWKDTDASGLVNLQELGMEQIAKSYSLISIGNLKSLTTLFLICNRGGTFPPLEPLSSCENLHRLWLSGGIEELANLNNLPKSITVLVLQSPFYTGLEEDPMPILGKFPNLKHLELSCAYMGKKITCNGNSFGQLETLRLEYLDNLESWHLHTTAMSVLKSLSIRQCPKLMKIPKRMEHIKMLDGNQSQREYYYRFPH